MIYFVKRGFRGHEKSENHVNAMIAWNEHRKRILTDTSMLNALDKKHQEVVEQNRTYIKTVAEVLLFTATQNISQRGHLETDASTKKRKLFRLFKSCGECKIHK